jgi:hypothetical protein
MNQKKLIAIAVLSAMHSGYRRAGFSLVLGSNDLTVNQEQLDRLEADPNVVVTTKAIALGDNTDELKTSTRQLCEQYDISLNENSLLNVKVSELTTLCAKQEQDILELESQLKTGLATSHTPTVLRGDVTLDLTTAPEALNAIIAAIHAKNCQAPLTSKPNCDQFGALKVSAEARDAAWDWYQEHVAQPDVIQPDVILSDKPESE